MLVVGEKINASIKSVGRAIRDRDEAFLTNLAKDQAGAGADFIDVNAGAGEGAWENAAAAMAWLIGHVQSATDRPLCIDSDDPAVLKTALKRYEGETVMINSVDAEPARLDTIGPLAAERGALLVALVMKEGGIPRTVEERLEAADFIMGRLGRYGVREDRVYFDPLVLPISVDTSQGLVTLRTIERIKARYPSAKTIMGLSNISFGLPGRGIVNRSFFLMAVAAGLDAAILNPLDPRLMSLVKVSEMLSNQDPMCRRFVRAFRKGTISD
ncbi:MAG TPA: dihydropteroate synthase [Syntrophales bacterium]|nr:dihydropteroate synthase [Syntrophales bacterium]HQB29486.1 dihydropteroate synthase [Syntrophales bacterium]HQN78299.1 dihydropteroate synthase [Syntrophales bacterium]HQQ27139.1 dihydropteroate synthase [Syntrophales bacterium]